MTRISRPPKALTVLSTDTLESETSVITVAPAIVKALKDRIL